MDFYKILNVSRTATVAEIKAAYRVLALKHHPDMHPPGVKRTESEATFKAITDAYRVLLDSKSREMGAHDQNRGQGQDEGKKYGYSHQRHADWAPHRRFTPDKEATSVHAKAQAQARAQAKTYSSSFHQSTAKPGGATSRMPNANPNVKFDIPLWNAAHYGDEDTNSTHNNTTRSTGSADQEYWTRRVEASRRQVHERLQNEQRRRQQGTKARNTHDDDSINAQASVNLRRKREERKTETPDKDDKGCVVS
jgi:curved DNA-binding protein CbpA